MLIERLNGGRGSYLYFSVILSLVFHITLAKSKSYYTVVSPSSLHPNNDYHVAITSSNPNESQQFFVSIHKVDDVTFNRYRSDSLSREARLLDSDSVDIQETIIVEPFNTRIVNFEIGDIPPGSYNLTVRANDFHESHLLEYVAKSYSVFVQTDKAIYKPGHIIRFRCVVLDKKLRPGVTGTIVVRIKDGEANLVKQWPRALTTKGVFSGEIQLSDYPVLGDWTIEVLISNQTFTKKVQVAEYVLPKFEVKIVTPKFVTFKEGRISVTVQAKYAYGTNVKGELTVSTYPLIYSGVIQPIFNPPVRHVVSINGETTLDVDVTGELDITDEFARPVNIEAVVEEENTGRRQNTSAQIIVYKYPYRIQLFKSAEYYKPGLNYTAQLMVAYLNGTPAEANLPITVHYGFTYDSSKHHAYNFVLNQNGMVELNIPTPENSSAVLEIEAEFRDLKEAFPAIAAAISSNGDYLQLNLMTPQKPRVNDDIVLSVMSNRQFDYLTYHVFGRGDLLIANTLRAAGRRSMSIHLKATPQMAPTAHLIAHYINSQGELIADAISLDIDGTLQNFVNISTNYESIGPSKDVEITVQTRPRSYVAILGIDQKVLQLRSGNDITQKDVENELRAFDVGMDTPYRNTEEAIMTPTSWRPGSDAALEAFKASGAVILTNSEVPENLPKRNGRVIKNDSINVKADIGPEIPLASATRPPLAGPYAFSRIPKPRLLWNHPKIFLQDLFPPVDTWIFSETSTGNEGKTSFHRVTPDSITSWSLTAFSLDPVWGLGLTQQPTKLRVFQQFFVTVDLPYSVRRGEIVAISVVVQNYFKETLETEITFDNQDRTFEFAEMSNEIEPKQDDQATKIKRLRVEGNSANSVSFMIKARQIGHIPIKVTAKSPLATDIVQQKLLVIAEGIVQKENKAILIDLRDARSGNYQANITIDIPKNRVPNSEYIEISAVGDLLGPMLTNLDTLIELPFGCGEQNMLKLVPNILVMNYLKNTNQLTPAIEQKAIKYIEVGYQQELTYKRHDNSFSAFGNSDESGSVWLTAFVVKSFKQAQPFISVDESIIEKGLEWIAKNQAPNGSFPEVGKVSHKDMQGGAHGSVALTAYTLIAFLEQNENLRQLYRLVIERATNYLANNIGRNNDIYALAITAYALQLSDHPKRQDALDLLSSVSHTTLEQRWWQQELSDPLELKNPWRTDFPNSINIEITSYAMLAILKAGYVTDTLPVLKWLVAQRNSNGGFQSTQDTVIGLQALSQLGEKLSNAQSTLQIKYEYKKDATGQFNINRDNLLVLQRHELPTSTKQIKLEANGNGFAVIQVSYKYNVNVTGGWPMFTLDPQVDKNSNKNHLQLSICSSFIGNKNSSDDLTSNMAVMEVTLPSGYQADPDSLPSLRAYKHVKRVETRDSDTQIVMYFDHLHQKQEYCPTVSAYRTHKVAKQNPVPVRVYDYYDNSRQARVFYEPRVATLCDICENEDCNNLCSTKPDTQLSDGNNKTLESKDGSGATNYIQCNNILALLSILMIINNFVN